MVNKTIQKKVIQYVKDNFEHIPKEGFIAGQAIASLVYKFLNLPLSVVINDIDIFVKANNFTVNNSDVYLDVKRLDIDFLNVNEYNKVVNFTGRGYRVIRSQICKKNPLINIIQINTNNKEENNYNDLIISSFDLNCCSVGYDIKTEKFYFTKSFLMFLKTLTLKVQSAHTPFHTLLRLNKKLKEIKGINCNLHLEQSLLINIIFKNNLKNSAAIITGIRFWENLHKQGGLIKNWFKFGDYFVEKNRIYKRLSMPEYLIKSFNISKPLLQQENSFFEKKIKINFNNNQLVHLFYLQEENILFSKKYKQKIINNINDDDLFYFLYFKNCSMNPLSELNFSLLNDIEIISNSLKSNIKFIKHIRGYENTKELKKISQKLTHINNMEERRANLILDSNYFNLEEMIDKKLSSDTYLINKIKEKIIEHGSSISFFNNENKFVHSHEKIESHYINKNKEKKYIKIQKMKYKDVFSYYVNGDINLINFLKIFTDIFSSNINSFYLLTYNNNNYIYVYKNGVIDIFKIKENIKYKNTYHNSLYFKNQKINININEEESEKDLRFYTFSSKLIINASKKTNLNYENLYKKTIKDIENNKEIKLF